MVLTRKELNEMVKNIITNILNENRKCTFRFDECTLHTLMEDGSNGMLFEAGNFILRKSSWEVNNYKRFLDIIKKTPADKKGFLTWHGMDEIQGDDWVTYTLKKYDVAFALHYIEDGKLIFVISLITVNLKELVVLFLNLLKWKVEHKWIITVALKKMMELILMVSWVISIERQVSTVKLGETSLILRINQTTLNGVLILKNMANLMLKGLNCQSTAQNIIRHIVSTKKSLTRE